MTGGMKFSWTVVKGKHVREMRALLIYLMAIAAVTLQLRIFHTIPLIDSLLWFFGVFFCFYVPGKLLLNFSRAKDSDHMLTVIHSLALGMAIMPMLYGIFRWLQFPPLILFFCLGTLLVWGLPKLAPFFGRMSGEGKEGLSLHVSTILSVGLLSILILFLLHISHFTDLHYTAAGFQMRSTEFNETDFHLGIVNALRGKYPPVFPYASGTSYSHYHISMHLEIEMFHRLFGIDTITLSFFYFPLLYFFLLVTLPYLVVRAFLGNNLIAFVTSCLMFGSDLSFIPGMMGVNPGRPWTVLFQTTIWSLFTLNGNLPALSVFFLGLLHFKKYFDSGSYRELTLFSVLGIAMLGFKSSMGLHVAAASLMSGAVLSCFPPFRKRAITITAASMLLLAFMLLDIFVIRGGTGNQIVAVDLFNVFRSSLKKFQLNPHSWYAYAALFAVYVIASFGARIAGFWKIREVFSSKRDPVIIYLLIFTLAGFLLSEMISIRIFIGNVNNAMWFSVSSLTAAWVLLSYTLAELEGRPMLFRSVLITVLVISLPTTVQFLSKRFDSAYFDYGNEATEVIRAIDRAPSATVVLHPLNESEPSLSANFAGQQTVLSFYDSLNMMPLREEEFLRRVKDVVSYFNPASRIDRAKVIERYEVTHVYARAQFTDLLEQEPYLAPVIKNGAYVLYEVRRP
jgi:hypothetical protein